MLQLWTELTEAVTRAATEKDHETFEVCAGLFLFDMFDLEQFTYLSVIFVQPFKLSNSMFLQFCANVLDGKSKTFIVPV